MQVLLAVLDDLFQFAHSALFGVAPVSVDTTTPPVLTLTESVRTSPPKKSAESHFHSIGEVLHMQGQYFVCVPRALVYVDPVISFDSSFDELTYGEIVHVVKFKGRWAQIAKGDTIGWIDKDSLAEKAVDVFPKFSKNEVYAWDHHETIKLRHCIDDMFCCGKAGLPLHCAEYVQYTLMRKKRLIAWPPKRPRIPGTWQRTLSGVAGIHISVTPKTESVIECIIDDIGYLGFVDAVFPDASIKVSAVGMPKEGSYTEEILTKVQWREFHPVFIEIT